MFRLICLLLWMGAAHAAAPVAPPPILPAPPAAKAPAGPTVIRVGPHQRLLRAEDAAAVAHDGDTILFEPGDYFADVAVWNQNGITLRGDGGRARFLSLGQVAEGKAIWVIKGTDVVVENIAFEGAKAGDANGAGIRHEGGRLTVRNCLFTNNQMGLLTSNSDKAELVVEASEFHHNLVGKTYKDGDPLGHQVYVGTIARFTLRDSYVHHGRWGHLVKTRAKESRIFNNRLTDEIDGRASYELEFPNGGQAYVVGNIIEQGSQTDNPTIVSFGAEGYKWPRNEIYLAFNTLADDKPSGGRFLRVATGAQRIVAVSNLLVGGGGGLEVAGAGDYRGNVQATWEDFALAVRLDYRLRAGSRLLGKATDAGEANGVQLRLTREYVHPLASRPVPAGPLSPGALQTPAQ